MSERHARVQNKAAPGTAERAQAPLWPFPMIDRDDDLQERLDAYRARMQAAIAANEVLMRGFGCAAQKSLDVLQAVVDAARDDVARAMRAEQPEASARVQVDSFHSRSRELLDGMRSVADDVYECWFSALDKAWAPTSTAADRAADDPDRAASVEPGIGDGPASAIAGPVMNAQRPHAAPRHVALATAGRVRKRG